MKEDSNVGSLEPDDRAGEHGPGFRSRLQSDPAGALASYELTPEERAALSSGDHEAIHAERLDARVTKQYGDPPLDNPAAPGDAYPQGPFS